MRRYKIIFLLFLIFESPLILHAQTASGLRFESTQNKNFAASGFTKAVLRVNTSPDKPNPRESRCLYTGQWLGLLSGAGIGLLHTYWSIKYTPDPRIPIWKHLAAGIPPALLSAYVGKKTMKWATRQILKGNPKPAKALFKGAFYGAVAGTIILASNYAPFFIASYYLETIHFNKLGNGFVPIKLIGISVLGSIAYGGTFGAVAGAVYGPCISFYMRF